jgi:hypothetical protein
VLIDFRAAHDAPAPQATAYSRAGGEQHTEQQLTRIGTNRA